MSSGLMNLMISAMGNKAIDILSELDGTEAINRELAPYIAILDFATSGSMRDPEKYIGRKTGDYIHRL
jgi:hypothetical protein